MFHNTRFIKSLALGGSTLVALAFGAAQANAGSIFLAPTNPAAIPGGDGLSVRVSVAEVGNQWSVSLRNFSTTTSNVTGVTFESGLGSAGGPFANVGSIVTYGVDFDLDTNPVNPAGFAGSAFGFQAGGTGIAEDNPDVFFFRMDKILGETRSAQDIADLFNTGGFRVAVNLIVPGAGSYEFVSGPFIPGNDQQVPDGPSGSVAPTPAALGAGLAMLSVLAMKRRRDA